MTIAQIYQQYQIPLNLQQHMYRVAAVGQTIIDSWLGEPLPTNQIIQALLLHDMGNIVKFDLHSFLSKQLLSQTKTTHDLAYWQKIQQEFRTKYGRNAHLATMTICRELSLSQTTLNLVKAIEFDASTLVISDHWPKKVCNYADLRVGPKGIMSIENRFVDLKKRYQHRDSHWNNQKVVAQELQFYLKIQDQLQAQTQINITEIADQSIEPLLKALPQVKLED